MEHSLDRIIGYSAQDMLNRIIGLLKEQGKTQKDLTDYLGVKNGTFTAWKAGRNTSFTKYLPQISEFLGVSAEFLVSGDDNGQTANYSTANDVLDRIIALLKEQGKMQKELTEYLGLQKNNFTAWKAGDSRSYLKFLPQISTFLNVPVDYLISGEKEKPTADYSDEQFNKDFEKFSQIYNRLDKEKQALVREVMTTMINQIQSSDGKN